MTPVAERRHNAGICMLPNPSTHPRIPLPTIAAGALALLLSSSALAAEVTTRTRGSDAPTAPYSDEVVQFINERIRLGWHENSEDGKEIQPSERADDAVWFRRVHLDLVGHIPPVDDIEPFLKSREPAKRSAVIEALLDDPAYVHNWTTIWTNLLIGRVTPRRVNREAMQKFLREAFAKSRPWNEIVHDLITAEGHFSENGAVNYLLAQMTMNDEAVQATAKTTQLLMGIQVQCTQCHNHPFNDWKQAQFWQFNSFFRQAKREDHRKYNPQTGRNEDDYSELITETFEGPVYFERRNGLMEVAYPNYFNTEIDPSRATNRRAALAELMTAGEKPWIALAIVNRLWAHFFGYGFTRPIDDMGPHNPPTDPELLDRLSREFVASGYDLKLLIRRICNTESYHLTSRFGRHNALDDPEVGQLPLFSRTYVKPLQAEQLYDSLLIATAAHRTGRADLSASEKQRREWLSQFVIAFGTDENDETTTFNGTIPQALMMMNGELIKTALSTENGSFLQEVLAQKGSDGTKVRRLYLATLSRPPEQRELSLANQLLKASADKVTGYRDLFWALLNSNEFILNH